RFCPFAGPVFPTPKTLSTNEAFQSSLTKLTTSIKDAISSGSSAHGPLNANDTYSIQIFSASDQGPLLDFHHRGVGVVNDRPIDGDSIYRIASTTKILTAYLLLLQAGDTIFNDPVTKYLPELTGHGHWNDITVGALAGYAAGIVSDGNSSLHLRSCMFPDAFPPLDEDEISPCAYGKSGCTRAIFLEHIKKRPSVFLPNTTPAYSNAGFATLGLVLESVTKMPYAEALRSLLADPLQLRATTVVPPSNSSHGVFVGDEGISGWNSIIDGAGTGMGAAFSSVNDLSAIGRAILSSSLLNTNTTRAWLKPTTHTSSLIGAIGRPWEIFRATLGPAENNRVVDLYTKGGNYLGHGANFVLIPDFDIGFVVVMAGRAGTVPFGISGIIVDHLLPAIEEAARLDADETYAGTYRATNGVNSSLTLATKRDVPGLVIESWISNGTDMLRVV
ncbi:beta-lactamase/transpeptidase-like protein, partial [Periconia macrospinosa]